ncbi:MAG: nuclear transport factor 2 family protein [Planctomycetes bacterium]|nr:nuclear transport factor 2 family protein [Planctomycetota bacterium]
MRHRTGSAISTALLSATSALLIVSCTPRATPPPRDDARAVAERFVAAFSEGDYEELRALLAEEMPWDLEGLRRRQGVGRERLLGELRGLRQVVPDARLAQTELFVEGERVMVSGRLRGRMSTSVSSLSSWLENELYGPAHLRLLVRDGRIEALHWTGGSLRAEELPGSGDGELSGDPRLAWVIPALDLEGPTRAITLDPYPSRRDPLEPEHDPLSGERRRFDEYAVTGSAPVEDEDQRRELSRLLYRGLCFGPLGALCFQPRHALEIEREGQKFWVVICFECSRGYVEGPDRKIMPFAINRESEPGFSEIYRSLGLTLAPKID